jgi:hypothetical protein
VYDELMAAAGRKAEATGHEMLHAGNSLVEANIQRAAAIQGLHSFWVMLGDIGLNGL